MAEILTALVSSKTNTVEISGDKPTIIIGERINPTGRKKVLVLKLTLDTEALEAGHWPRQWRRPF
jgi:cobalamin-dependent methionine synthase I